MKVKWQIKGEGRKRQGRNKVWKGNERNRQGTLTVMPILFNAMRGKGQAK